MRTILTAMLAIGLMCVSFGQSVTDMWTPAPTVKPSDFRPDQIRIKASAYYATTLDLEVMKATLETAPKRFTSAAAYSEVIVTVPRPDGVLEYFKVLEAPVMHPDLAKKYPTIRTYAGVGLGTSGSFIRLDVTPLGFHAMVRTDEGMYFVDPMAWGETEVYMSHWKKDFLTDEVFECGAAGHDHDDHKITTPENSSPEYGDCQFRTYVLALACTGEYATFHGGTLPLVMAAMNTTMNRVNGIYETEVSVTMELHPNNDTLVFLDAATDPYTNSNASALLTENVATCNARIGSANYDVGHVFSTGGGGLAGLGVICSTSKARGETGSGSPIGDAFDVDYVAHELGHQFGGAHTFYSATGSCNGNQSSTMAYEPGSGTTIQAYAGICGAANVQPNSDAYFHAGSLSQITAHITGSANSCAAIVNTPNNDPTANAGADYIIPKSTPFLLTGVGTDPDGDVVRYCWEQYDLGSGTAATATPTSTQTSGPVFRSRMYTTSPQRYFPPLANVVAGTTSAFEILPSVARTLNFRLTTRDVDAIDGGCTATDLMLVTVNGTAGPFLVTAPNTAVSYPGSSSQTVTWDVASTNMTPINCANVDILLSTDGGVTFPTVLLANTPNDGSQAVVIPNTASTTARIMVRSVGNIFYDVSNANFTITATTGPFIALTAAPNTVTACTGNSGTSTLTVSSGGGFSGAIALTASGVPAGASLSFSSSSVTNSGTSTLTFNNATAATGTYTVTITGTGGALTSTTTVALTIANTPAATTGLTAGTGSPIVLTWSTVAGATSYVVEISATNTFASILETATPATASYSVVGAGFGANTTYFWRVRAVNACGAGANTSSSFTTPNIVCNTYSPTGLPIAITATGTPTINSTVNVTAAGTITDVDILGLAVAHTYVSDLEVRLLNPASSSRIMFDNLCSSNDNIALSLDDEAATVIPCPSTGGGTHKPSQTLSFFDGGNATGTWTLQIADLADQDGGSLTAWSLRVCYAPTSTPLSVTATSTNATCSANGAATATATGGNGTYTYAWSNGATTASISGLAAGVYTVTATSASATATASVTVSQPSALTVAATATSIDCFGGTATVTVSATGGTAPYSGTGSFTATAGTHTYTVTDANGCTQSATLVISQPLALTVTATATSIDCFGGTATVTVGAIGGTAPYSGVGSFTVTAGTHTYAVTDANGCIQSTTIVVTQPSALTVTATATAIPCNGGTATVTVGAIGGTAPYSGVGSFTVTAGTHTYAVTDANGCIQSTTIVVTQPSALTVTAASSGNTVTATASGGGSIAYSYLWSNGATTASISGVASGTYVVTVSNPNGCTATASATVSNALPLTIVASGTNLTCNGSANGAASVTATGGNGSYTYAWSNGATTASISGLAAGAYTVTVTSGVETAVSSVTLTQPNAITVTTSGTNATTTTGTGSATATASGGVTPYTYLWSNGGTTATISGVAIGLYTVTVTGSNGCTKTATRVVSGPAVTITITKTNVSCFGGSNANASATAAGGNGTYSYLWSTGATTAAISGLAAGTYTVTVTSGPQTSSKTTVITQPVGPFTATPTATNSTCGLNNGKVTLVMTNGTAASYVWSTGVTTSSISNVAAGTYTVTVNSTLGCVTSTSATIAPSSAMAVTLAAIHPSGGSNGSLTANVTGGIAPYTYLWNGTSTTQTISNLGGGTYTVTVTATGGCTKTARQQLYCVMTGNSVSEWIQRVQFSSTNNNSGNNGGYGNFTALPAANVVRGVSTPITLVPGYAGVAQSERWRVWVDNNNDGDFADSGENLRTITGTNTINTTFTVPTTAPTGTHRMRVAVNRTANPSNCGAIANGEGEDYLINVVVAGALQSDITDEEVAEAMPEVRLTLQPNPANQLCIANFEAIQAGRYTIVVADMNGRIAIQQTIEAQQGNNQLSLDLTNIANGMYTVSITGDGQRTHKTLIVNH